jgi:hypothetical protein
MSNTRRKDIIAKGKRSRADYLNDAELNTLNDAWRDADGVLTEQKMQEQQTKKRKRGGKGRKTNTKSKSKKHRKNKLRKSSRRNHKK